MTFSIGPVGAYAPFQAVASNNTQLTADDQQPERNLIEMNKEYIGQLQQMLKNLMADQAGRTATIQELFDTVSALKDIDLNSAELLDPTVFNKQIQLDPRSPAGMEKEGEKPIKSMSVWKLLVTYDICKEGDVKPTSHAQLKVLIDKVENRNAAISSMSQTKAIELNRYVSSRDQAFSLNSNLIRQLMDLLQSIIKQMG